MVLSHFEDVYLHMSWADSSIWKAVLASPEAASDDYVKKTMHHIHETQQAFLGVWKNRPFKRRKLEEFESMDDVYAWGVGLHDELPSIFDSLSESDLSTVTVLPWAHYFARTLGSEPHQTTLQDTLHQLASHSMHHRGQVSRRLRELNQTPPTVDYIVWVWAGRPTADWS